MTQIGSPWLTAMTSSPIGRPVTEVELQNKNQRAHHKHEKMRLWFYVVLMVTLFVMPTVPFPGENAIAA